MPLCCTLWYMNVLSSTRFRVTFHSLTEPTEVTVNGHVIGTYYPAGTVPISAVEALHGAGLPRMPEAHWKIVDADALGRQSGAPATRTFTPVPKPVAPPRPTRPYR